MRLSNFNNINQGEKYMYYNIFESIDFMEILIEKCYKHK